MSAELLQQFAKYGGLAGLLIGVVLMGVGVAIIILWKHIQHLQEELYNTQDKRAEEAKEVRAELIKFSEDSNKALIGVSEAVRSLRDAIFTRGRK